MRATYFLILLLSLKFSGNELLSKYLIQKPCGSYCALTIDRDDSLDENKFIQIFSPFNLINVYSQNKRLKNVLQTSFMIPNLKFTINIESVTNSFIWYRVLNATGIFINSNLNLDIVKISDSHLSIKFDKITKDSNSILYQLWVIPIYPSGQVTSWSSEFSSYTKNKLIPAVNLSIDNNYLKTNGQLITESKPTTTFNLVNRNLYSYLIIIQLTDSKEFQVQLTPAIIYGCLSTTVFSSTYSIAEFQVETNTCRLIKTQVWFNITCAALSFIILFILTGCLNEIFQIFVSSWVITAYISCIGYHYIFGSIFESGIFIYVILFGVSLGLGIFLSCCGRCCKKGNRLRMFFNTLCIILIVVSIVWFCCEYFTSNFVIIISVISCISFVCLIFLMICSGFTSTFGSTFIGVSLMSVGFSLITIQSSAVPFLFLDFFSFILNRKLDISYYSLFLKDDVIIMSFWMFLTLFIGALAHRSWHKNHFKKKSTETSPILLTPTDNYRTTENNIHLNVITTHISNSYAPPAYANLPEYTPQPQNTPWLTAQPTAPVMDNEPPPYQDVI